MSKLTDEEIDSLQARRALDALIHKHIFGFDNMNLYEGVWPKNRTNQYPGTEDDWVKDSVPYYSTNISAAWEVIQKMVEAKVLMNISYGTKTWNVNFSTQKQYRK